MTPVGPSHHQAHTTPDVGIVPDDTSSGTSAEATKHRHSDEWRHRGGADAPVLLLTAAAAQQMREYRQRSVKKQVIRLRLQPDAALDQKYELEFVAIGDRAADDVQLEEQGLQFLLDKQTAQLIKGTRIDYVVGMWSSGFSFEAPDPILAMSDGMAAEVSAVLESQVNPSLSAHGGSVGLVDVRDGIVYLQFSGGCKGCGLAPITMKELVRRTITTAIPNVRAVVDVTEHSLGTTPYYPSATSPSAST